MSVHVVPRGDLIEHDTNDDCVCGPSSVPAEVDGNVIGWVAVHHSLDGREQAERALEA